MIVAIVEAGAGLAPVIEFRQAADAASAVAQFCSEHTPPLDPADFLGAEATGLDLLLSWTYDLGAGSFVEDLDKTQTAMIAAIKEHRDGQRLALDLLAEYPSGAGNLFSCSAASQDNWSKLATLDAQGAVSYPFVVTTHDERGSYSLVDSADREAATLAISSVVLTERATAELAITGVLAATTAAAARAAAASYLGT